MLCVAELFYPYRHKPQRFRVSDNLWLLQVPFRPREFIQPGQQPGIRTFPHRGLFIVTEYQDRALFDPALLLFRLYRELSLPALRMCQADPAYRADPALRLPVGDAHNGAQLDQALVEISRRLRRDHFFHLTFDLCPGPCLRDVAPVGCDPCHHPEHISVHCRLPDAVHKRADSPGRIIPDPFEPPDLFVRLREPPAVFLHDLAGRFLQIAGAVIVSQSFPQLQQTVFRHFRQRLHIRQFLQKSLIIRLHRLHTGLLEHDLRDPHPVRIHSLSPRQVSLILTEPLHKRLYCLLHLRAVQHCIYGFRDHDAVRSYITVISEDLDPRLLCPPQRFRERGMGIRIGREIRDALHLDHKENICLIPFLFRPDQLLQMLYRTVAGSVREPAHPVLFQRHAFHFDKDLSVPGLNVQVKPGIPVRSLRPYKGHVREQIPGLDPFLYDAVRDLGIHIDQTLSPARLLLHSDQVPLRLPLRIVTLLHIDHRARAQELRAAPGILHMYRLFFPI